MGNIRHSTDDVVVARTSLIPNVRSFIILLLGEGLTSFKKNNRANLSGEKSTIKLSGVHVFLRIRILVVILESKGLNYLFFKFPFVLKF